MGESLVTEPFGYNVAAYRSSLDKCRPGFFWSHSTVTQLNCPQNEENWRSLVNKTLLSVSD